MHALGLEGLMPLFLSRTHATLYTVTVMNFTAEVYGSCF